MAKIEGPQNIPSEIAELYSAFLTPALSDNSIRGRCPFTRPLSKAGGPQESEAQKKQRARFKQAIEGFKNTPYATRHRWYSSAPIWNSFLWYYNYYLLSALTGVTGLPNKTLAVIKSIQYVSKSIPTGGAESITISTVDPDKTVVMLFGNSYISDKIHHYDGVCDDNSEQTINLSPSIDPAISEVKLTGAGGYMGISGGDGEGFWGDFYITEVNASSIKLKLQNLYSSQEYGYSLDIIEHKAQTIYPYVSAVSANSITISWPVTPSVASTIGAIVIEYI